MVVLDGIDLRSSPLTLGIAQACLALLSLNRGLGKDVGAALAVGLGVLLGAEDNGLGAMQAVDAVDVMSSLHYNLFGCSIIH